MHCATVAGKAQNRYVWHSLATAAAHWWRRLLALVESRRTVDVELTLIIFFSSSLPDTHFIERHLDFFCTYAGYLTGDRFSSEFIMRRCMELQLFLERVCRHPLLQRAKILQQFLESNEWHIDMHTHSGQPIASTSGAPAPEVTSSSTGGILESMSDMFVNAFTRVRKPDPRFVAMKTGLEGEEDRIIQWERVLLRNRTHVSGMFSGSLAWLVGCCIA